MPKGEQSPYTDMQKRQAERIANSYETRSSQEGSRGPLMGDRQQQRWQQQPVGGRAKETRYEKGSWPTHGGSEKLTAE